MIEPPVEPTGEDPRGSAGDEPAILYGWTARNVRPVVVLYVTAVFAAFIALAFFAFHSVEAVKALATTLIASVVALLANVVAKTEYQLTESGLRKRPFNAGKPKDFKEAFSWEEVDHVIPKKHGFNYFRLIEDSNPFLRFWKAHLSASFSGEVHVEQPDQEKVMGHLARRNIPTSKPVRPLGKGPDEIPGRAPGEPGAR
jgi:hypothetical protein